MIDQEQNLGILIPDGKHIRPVITRLLERRGFRIGQMRRNGTLHGDVDNSPVTLTVQPSGNIVEQVAEGRFFQIGFVGSDRFAEYLVSLPKTTFPRVELLQRFELFPPSVRLSFLVRDSPADNVLYQAVTSLRNRRLVTTYPGLAREFLYPYFPEEEKVPVRIDSRRIGKEEGLVSARAADAALVIVESGGTMISNRLRELEVVKRDIQPIAVVNSEYYHKRRGSQVLWDQLEQFSDRLQSGRRQNRFLPGLFGIQLFLALRNFKLP